MNYLHFLEAKTFVVEPLSIPLDTCKQINRQKVMQMNMDNIKKEF
jgi:hypothetical protein